MQLYTHPDNVKQLKEGLGVNGQRFDSKMMPVFFDLIADKSLERTKKTGRYILPDGTVAARCNVQFADSRFMSWGPEDVDLLLWMGLIREETEMLVYQVNDWMFKNMFDTPTVIEPRSIMVNGFC